eukprot:TRINITY_DN11572_c0_g1_i2.p1 TRINITY_DN11572_c0_g1~~TRINITY_DN11572_c0_g1_i2.p1  ORF type:complete len:500 (-),score=106.98 TRINITY_DN11572_c0_g1_i2:168-1667(-)
MGQAASCDSSSCDRGSMPLGLCEKDCVPKAKKAMASAYKRQKRGCVVDEGELVNNLFESMDFDTIVATLGLDEDGISEEASFGDGELHFAEAARVGRCLFAEEHDGSTDPYFWGMTPTSRSSSPRHKGRATCRPASEILASLVGLLSPKRPPRPPSDDEPRPPPQDCLDDEAASDTLELAQEALLGAFPSRQGSAARSVRVCGYRLRQELGRKARDLEGIVEVVRRRLGDLQQATGRPPLPADHPAQDTQRILRFVLSEGGTDSSEGVVQRLVEFADWWERHDVDSIRGTVARRGPGHFPHAAEVSQCVPNCACAATTASGHLVSIFVFDARRLSMLQRLKRDHVQDYLRYFLQLVDFRLHEKAEETKCLAGSIVLFDLQSVPSTLLSLVWRKVLQPFMAESIFYKEVHHRIFVVNAPAAFSASWYVLSRLTRLRINQASPNRLASFLAKVSVSHGLPEDFMDVVGQVRRLPNRTGCHNGPGQDASMSSHAQFTKFEKA